MSSSSSSSTGSPLPSAEDVKTEVVEASKQTLSSFRSLIAGGVGGVCAVVVGHPFDLVKVRMQTAEKGVYSGAIDVVRKTIAREGLRKVCHIRGSKLAYGADEVTIKGLYAGVSAPLVGVTPMCERPSPTIPPYASKTDHIDSQSLLASGSAFLAFHI